MDYNFRLGMSQLNLNILTHSFIKKKLYKKGIIVFYILISYDARLLVLFTLSHNYSIPVLDLVLFLLLASDLRMVVQYFFSEVTSI